MVAPEDRPTAPEIRLDVVPGMSRGADGRIRGIVTGVTDAEAIDRILTLAPPAPDGQAAPIYVIDSEGTCGGEWAAGRSWNGRVRVFSGADAAADFLRSRTERLECSLPDHVATCLNGERPLSAAVVVGLQGLAHRQAARLTELTGNLAAAWRVRGMEHWRTRYAEIQDRSDARVLVITSRYSTFVRYSAEDLVQGINAVGHRATLLMEPEDGETLTGIAYLQAIAETDPDLIVQINYPRWTMGAAVPQGWPHLCWVQDAMPHLFQGAGLAGPLDFVAGHLYKDAMARAGYRPEQMLPHRVCVSERKFHPRRAESDARFMCDVAYVSHRAETAEAFLERFCRESDLPASARPAIDTARQEIDSIVTRWPEFPAADLLPGVAATLARALGRGEDARSVELLTHRFVRPYAEQRLRHETLEWAAAVCGKHGLTLRIYGNGWERHPTLARHAGGPIAHGEDLRRCYQLAGAHLHASIDGGGHQRIAECAMSGGMPLCRRSWSELFFADWIAAREFMLENRPFDVCYVPWRRHAHIVADHPSLLRLIRNSDRMGHNPHGWDHARLPGLFALTDRAEPSQFAPLIPEPHMRSLAIFSDPLEATFSTPEELEDRILKALERGSWREQLSESIAQRASECFGVSRFVERVLGFVSAAIVQGRSGGVANEAGSQRMPLNADKDVPPTEGRRHVAVDQAKV